MAVVDWLSLVAAVYLASGVGMFVYNLRHVDEHPPATEEHPELSPSPTPHPRS